MATTRVGRRKKSPGRPSSAKRVTRLRKRGRRNPDASYLRGIGPGELKLLDKATVRARKDLDAMADRLDATNKKLTGMFAKLERLENAALQAWLVKALRQGRAQAKTGKPGPHKHYVLSKADSEIFLKALDRPPRATPALRRLLGKKRGKNLPRSQRRKR